MVVRAEPRWHTAWGGHQSGRSGDARPERSRDTGWSLEQSLMEIERERRGPGAVQIERERDREERTGVGKKA
jgi:hypothetical protein